jgi:signal peptidase I
LNGHPLSESFIWHKFPNSHNPAIDIFGPTTVPAGKYFVLGDNLDISSDSRNFGLVDANAIVGKALYSYQFMSAPLSRRLD